MARNINIYAPWVIFGRKVEKLFEKDSGVNVVVSDDGYEIKLYVEDERKAEALRKLLPMSKKFGNVRVDIKVISANENQNHLPRLIEAAFDGNGAFSHLTAVEEIPEMYISNPIYYCVFKKEVVQYAADNLGSESGMDSTLYEDLARDVFDEVGGVYYCTDVE